MWMLVIGLLLLAAKLADIGPTAAWSWWAVAAPFIAAAVWWQFADATGLTRRRAMKRMDERKEQRRDRALEALGLGTRRTGKVTRAPGESRSGRESQPSRSEPRR